MPIQQMLLGSGPSGPVTGQVDFDDHSSLDYSTTWTVPDGVEYISVLCIGRGGVRATGLWGGAGGSLAYFNSIAVVPGDTYNIYLCGGASATDNCTISPFTNNERWVVGSRIRHASGSGVYWEMVAFAAENHVAGVSNGAGGSESHTSSLVHGSFASYKGGNGGQKGTTTQSWGQTNYYPGGGGGAAGYAGNGGTGGSGANSGTADNTAGAGGGGGGGAGGWYQDPSGQGAGTFGHAGGGGGVGKFGQGSNGAKATSQGYSGVGGSGGTPTSSLSTNQGVAGIYGGGNSDHSQGFGFGGAVGGKGLVRIIWPGDTRYYPNTNTANQ